MHSFFSAVAFTWHLHAVFVFTAFVGGILFISWAMKLKPDQLKKWVLWLLMVGIAGTLLTSGSAVPFWSMMQRGEHDGKNMMNMDQGMMKDGRFEAGRMIDGSEKANQPAQ